MRRTTLGKTPCAPVLAIAILAMLVVGCATEASIETAPPSRPATTGPATCPPAGAATCPPGGDGTTTMTLPISGGGDIQVTRTGPSQVTLGEPYESTFTITNTSPNTVNDVALKHDASDGIEVRSADIGDGAGQQAVEAGETQTWNVGTLGPGESRKITVTAVAGKEGQENTCLAVTYTPTVCAPVSVVNPQLAFERQILDAQCQPTQAAYACDTLDFRYTLTNTGTGCTQPATVRETLPEGLYTADGAREIEFEVPGIAAGETVTRDIAVRASDTLRYDGTAVARAGEKELQSQPGNIQIMIPELSLTVTGPGEVPIGRGATYEVTVANVSDYPAPNTVVSVQAPPDAMCAALGDGEAVKGNTFNAGTLEPGERKTFTVTVAGESEGTLSTTATACAYCADSVAQTVTTNVVGVPALCMNVCDLKDPVPVGETTTYSIKVINQGTAADTKVCVTAELPEGMEFVSGSGPTNVVAEGRRATCEPVVNLKPGETVEWKVIARATQPVSGLFTTKLVSDTMPRPAMVQEPTTMY